MKYLFVVISFLGMFTVASAQIAGSAHDFSMESWSDGKICEPCHTPHNSHNPGGPSWAHGPLWNHDNSLAVYTVYTSPTMDYPTGTPGTVSKLCLSCHDGTVAIDAFGGASGSTFMTGSAAVGSNSDLSNDHPIGIVWRHQTTRPNCTNYCHFIERKVKFFGPTTTVECASCHEPHNNSMNGKMLRAPLAGSELCFQCHTDKE